MLVQYQGSLCLCPAGRAATSSTVALEKCQIYGLAAANQRVDEKHWWEAGKQEEIYLLIWVQGGSLLFESSQILRPEVLNVIP